MKNHKRCYFPDSTYSSIVGKIGALNNVDEIKDLIDKYNTFYQNNLFLGPIKYFLYKHRIIQY